jgi:hypothetical protein
MSCGKKMVFVLRTTQDIRTMWTESRMFESLAVRKVHTNL